MPLWIARSASLAARASVPAGRAVSTDRAAIPFAAAEAALAAGLYARLRKARGREIDLAIAACALVRNAKLWTLNTEDFDDIPDLHVSAPDAT